MGGLSSFQSLHHVQPFVTHELQHSRLSCPMPTPGDCSNSCPFSQWCHPTTSSSVNRSPPVFNLSHHQGLFQWVASLRQGSKYWSFSFSISALNEHSGLISSRIDCISLQSKGLSRDFSNTTVQKHYFFSTQLSLWSNSPINILLYYWKNHSFDYMSKLTNLSTLLHNDYMLTNSSAKKCLCFLIALSRFFIAFLPRNKCLLISWLQLPSAVILEPRKIKSVTVSIVSPSIYLEVMGLDAIILALILRLCFLWKNYKYESFQLYTQAVETQKIHSWLAFGLHHTSRMEQNKNMSM